MASFKNIDLKCQFYYPFGRFNNGSQSKKSATASLLGRSLQYATKIHIKNDIYNKKCNK